MCALYLFDKVRAQPDRYSRNTFDALWRSLAATDDKDDAFAMIAHGHMSSVGNSVVA
jgi:hypothetical protein